MNVQPLNVTAEAARKALLEYKAHRNVYDRRDWEIERIYRAIAKGKLVISAHDAIRKAGVDELGRPKLAIMRADQEFCRCDPWSNDRVHFFTDNRSRASDLSFDLLWKDRAKVHTGLLRARLPRIPPQHRPSARLLAKYHLLWEADWVDIPRDPLLLKRLSRDAWIVLAAWDLTDVEVSVLRGNR